MVGFDRDTFCDWFKSGEGHRDFVAAEENAGEGVSTCVVGDCVDLVVGIEALQCDSRVGPDDLRLIRANGKDKATDGCGLRYKRRSE